MRRFYSFPLADRLLVAISSPLLHGDRNYSQAASRSGDPTTFKSPVRAQSRKGRRDQASKASADSLFALSAPSQPLRPAFLTA